jgi:hypothetical protein
MSRPLNPLSILAILTALACWNPPAAAQGNFEIQVYGSETTAPGTWMVELHSNSALRGTTSQNAGSIRPTQDSVHETLEVTHGWTPWFETGAYLFTSIQQDQGWEWVGAHLRPRVRVPEASGWPVGLGLSVEVGYQQRTYSQDTWTLEIRPIIDKQIGPWYFAFNPVLDQSLKGPGTHTGIEFSPQAKITYDLTKVVSPGLEYYGGLGPIGNFAPSSKQQQLLFAVVDLNFDPKWEFNFGVGVGLTHGSDGVIIKMILGRRF